MVKRFVSLGEVMVQFNPVSPGPIRHARYFEVHVAGSEANMLIGLSRLGFEGGLITRVGRDEFGRLILSTLRSEGIDVSQVRVDEEAPTGIYFIQRHYPVPGKSTVLYYRRGSAASRMSPEDVDEGYISKFDSLIITGITMALSRSCYEAVKKAYDTALKEDMRVILDTNIRMKLWGTPERASECIVRFLRSNIVFTNEEDLQVLFPNTPLLDGARKILGSGAELVVVKMGPKGALALTEKYTVKREGFRISIVEDIIGAGDAFNAAFLAAVDSGYSIEEALEYANAAGALAVTVRGDIEALPSWDDLRVFTKAAKRAVDLR